MTLASDPKPFSFLRLPAAAQRRRARPWVAFARRFARAALIAGPVLALCVWLLFSPRFRVTDLEVSGAQRVAPVWLDAQVDSARGSNILLADLDDLRASLEAHPWVRSATISKRLPNLLEVEVVEHQPVAALKTRERMAVISHYGEIIEDPAAALEEPGLKLVLSAVLEAGSAEEKAVITAALAAGQAVRSASPSWCRSLERVEVVSPGHLRLSFLDLEFPLLVRTETALERVLLFDRLKHQVVERYAPLSHVDLRTSRRIVLQPVEQAG